MADIDEHIERVDWGKQQDSGEVLLSPAWEAVSYTHLTLPTIPFECRSRGSPSH